MNLVVLQGNLVRDPELKYFDSNGKQTPYVNLTIAVSRFYKKADGNTVKDAVFIRCEAYDSGAETISKLFKKGNAILVRGTLREHQWEKDGQKQSQTKVRIDEFTKLDKREVEAVQQTENKALVGAEASTGAGDEIPF